MGLQLLVMPASAALSTDYPEDEPAEISISQQEIDALAERLEQVQRDDSGCFEIIDALSGAEEIRSVDYTVSSLNVWNGVAYLSEEDRSLLDQVLAEAGLTEEPQQGGLLLPLAAAGVAGVALITVAVLLRRRALRRRRRRRSPQHAAPRRRFKL